MARGKQENHYFLVFWCVRQFLSAQARMSPTESENEVIFPDYLLLSDTSYPLRTYNKLYKKYEDNGFIKCYNILEVEFILCLQGSLWHTMRLEFLGQVSSHCQAHELVGASSVLFACSCYVISFKM